MNSRIMMLGRQYWAIKVQFCFHIDTNDADEPSHPGWRPSTSNWQTNTPHQLSGPMASGWRRSELTLKSLKIIKTERTSSLDDCKSPPKMQVMPPTPMNSLYLQACGLVNAACRQPVRMATGIVVTRTITGSWEKGPWRSSWKW